MQDKTCNMTYVVEGIVDAPMYHKDIAGYLDTLLDVLIAINSGMGYSENMPLFYVFDAQSIVQKYCQSIGCNKETIEYVRKHYLLENFENLKIVDMGDGYSLVD